ncbi:hypothetical protein Q0M94_21140 (plasmid) [Deinococcus radiomollis]|uniref:hypothetical protein n=1 Tax=Deinococcus radiomollis TaxID=468916 RepID=UPI003891D856
MNSTLVLQAQDQQTLSRGGILGVEVVFKPKYGTPTPDLASYWSGCQGRAVRGLEGTCVTWIDPTTHQPVPLSITQIPATLPAAQSRVDFYATVTLNTILQLPDELKKQVQAVVGDAYYTKLKFIARVVDEGQLPLASQNAQGCRSQAPVHRAQNRETGTTQGVRREGQHARLLALGRAALGRRMHGVHRGGPLGPSETSGTGCRRGLAGVTPHGGAVQHLHRNDSGHRHRAVPCQILDGIPFSGREAG